MKCNGCRSDKRIPYCDTCKLYPCAEEKGIDFCGECDEYPCDNFEMLIKRYPALLGDGQILAEIGIDAWLEAQEERCNRGYCFADSRYDIEDQ